jgi:hypothetical protein
MSYLIKILERTFTINKSLNERTGYKQKILFAYRTYEPILSTNINIAYILKISSNLSIKIKTLPQLIKEYSPTESIKIIIFRF